MEVEEDQLEISQLMVKIQEEDAKMKRYKVSVLGHSLWKIHINGKVHLPGTCRSHPPLRKLFEIPKYHL